MFAVGAQNLSAQIPVIMIPGGSHCADMAGSRKDDTGDMIAARRSEEEILSRWISERKSETLQPPPLSSIAMFV